MPGRGNARVPRRRRATAQGRGQEGRQRPGEGGKGGGSSGATPRASRGWLRSPHPRRSSSTEGATGAGNQGKYHHRVFHLAATVGASAAAGARAQPAASSNKHLTSVLGSTLMGRPTGRQDPRLARTAGSGRGGGSGLPGTATHPGPRHPRRAPLATTGKGRPAGPHDAGEGRGGAASHGSDATRPGQPDGERGGGAHSGRRGRRQPTHLHTIYIQVSKAKAVGQAPTGAPNSSGHTISQSPSTRRAHTFGGLPTGGPAGAASRLRPGHAHTTPNTPPNPPTPV